MRKVVVNSTPLIVLCGINRLDILRMVYQEILIPTAAFKEVTVKDDSACAQLKTSKEWIHVVEIKDHSEKKMGIIESVKPLIAELIDNGFYVSDAVKRMILEQAGE